MATFTQQRVRKKKAKQKKPPPHTIVPPPMEIRRDHICDQLIEASRIGNSARVCEVLKRMHKSPIEFESMCTAFLCAAQFGSTNICDLILSKLSKSLHSQLINPALILSAKKGHISLAKYLLSRGADIETRGINGETALLIATDSAEDKMVKFLLNRGKADILATDNYGNNILHIACHGGYENIVYLILNYKHKSLAKSLTYAKNIYTETPIQVCKSQSLIRLILTHIISVHGVTANINAILQMDSAAHTHIKSPFAALPVDNPSHIATSHLFWRTIGCGKDRCIFQSFDVYPFDRLKDSERIVVLTRVAEAMSGYKTDIKCNVLNESTLFVVFAMMKRHISEEIAQSEDCVNDDMSSVCGNDERESNDGDRDRDMKNIILGDSDTEIDTDIESESMSVNDESNENNGFCIWRQRTLLAFEQLFGVDSFLCGLDTDVCCMQVWNAMIDLIACTIFGASYWHKKSMFGCGDTFTRRQVLRLKIDRSYWNSALPSSDLLTSQQIQVMYRKLVTMSKSLLRKNPHTHVKSKESASLCFCPDCIADRQVPLRFKLQFLEEQAEEKQKSITSRQNKKFNQSIKNKVKNVNKLINLELSELKLCNAEQLTDFWSGLDLKEKRILTCIKRDELGDILSVSPQWETLRASLHSYTIHSFESDMLIIKNSDKDSKEQIITLSDTVLHKKEMRTFLSKLFEKILIPRMDTHSKRGERAIDKGKILQISMDRLSEYCINGDFDRIKLLNIDTFAMGNSKRELGEAHMCDSKEDLTLELIACSDDIHALIREHSHSDPNGIGLNIGTDIWDRYGRKMLEQVVLCEFAKKIAFQYSKKTKISESDAAFKDIIKNLKKSNNNSMDNGVSNKVLIKKNKKKSLKHKLKKNKKKKAKKVKKKKAMKSLAKKEEIKEVITDEVLSESIESVSKSYSKTETISEDSITDIIWSETETDIISEDNITPKSTKKTQHKYATKPPIISRPLYPNTKRPSKPPLNDSKNYTTVAPVTHTHNGNGKGSHPNSHKNNALKSNGNSQPKPRQTKPNLKPNKPNQKMPSNENYDPWEALSALTEGFMFICSNETFAECMDIKLLGLPKQYLRLVKELNPDRSALFLFNMTERLLYGVYKATDKGSENINPIAWARNKHSARFSPFPAQIPFRIVYQFKPLPETAFRHMFNDGNRIRKLSQNELKQILTLYCNGLKPKLQKLVKSYAIIGNGKGVHKRVNNGKGVKAVLSVTRAKTNASENVWALRKQKRKKNSSNNVTPIKITKTATTTTTITPTKIEKKRSKPPQLMHNRVMRVAQNSNINTPSKKESVNKRLPTKPPIISVLNGNGNNHSKSPQKPLKTSVKSPTKITPIKAVPINQICPEMESETMTEELPVAKERFEARETETVEEETIMSPSPLIQPQTNESDDSAVNISLTMPIETDLSPINCVTVTDDIDTHHTNSGEEEIFGDSYLDYTLNNSHTSTGIDLTQTQEIIRSVWGTTGEDAPLSMETNERFFHDSMNEYNKFKKYNAHISDDSDENESNHNNKSLWSTDWNDTAKTQSKTEKILPPTPPPPMDPNNDELSDEFSDFRMFKFAQTATELNPKAKEWSQASPSTSATSTSNGKSQKLGIDTSNPCVNASPNMLTEMSIPSPVSVTQSQLSKQEYLVQYQRYKQQMQSVQSQQMQSNHYSQAQNRQRGVNGYSNYQNPHNQYQQYTQYKYANNQTQNGQTQPLSSVSSVSSSSQSNGNGTHSQSQYYNSSTNNPYTQYSQSQSQKYMAYMQQRSQYSQQMHYAQSKHRNHKTEESNPNAKNRYNHRNSRNPYIAAMNGNNNSNSKMGVWYCNPSNNNNNSNHTSDKYTPQWR